MHAFINFAYLDPGTGSLIIQSLIGAIAGVAVFGRRIFGSIRKKFSSKKNTQQTPAQTTDSPKKTDDTTK